ncbi:MAG: formylglycine-generating enzyme family protein [Candidatus Thiosymbion ectosymbiont of Robbea hypermnestra]|nr:formylglycine-generating enzyme family protein [Candidatus Thiosymbion ectosymbiont of Robbea hypermnestra]
MPELASFISAAHLERLFKALVSIGGEGREELARIGDVFGDPQELARFYVEPKCQHHSPADRHEDQEPVAQVGAPAFEFINDFLRGSFTPLGDGRTQLFILSDAGMGKTSLLMMLRLMHLTSFWPRGHDCLLLKLGEDTLDKIAECKDKARTVLLLDALDEDPLAWGNIESRLVALLDATRRFRRVIISCRTQFFPETGSDAFGRPGRVEVGEYICPMVFLSLFDEEQVDTYLHKRFPDRTKGLPVHIDTYLHKHFHNQIKWLPVWNNPERRRATVVVDSMRSLRFRLLLLAHIRDILDTGEQDWNTYRLYRVLVNRWLVREERKLRDLHKQFSKPLSKETLWHVCTAVALYMQSRGNQLLRRQELDALMADFLDLITGLQPSALAGFGFRDRLQEGSLGPWMQPIPAGEFVMGSGNDDPFALPDERPRHPVTITQAFALGRYPVTFEEYDRFVAATGRERPDDAGWGRGRRPVIDISWQDAVAYCAWLSKQTGARYRLLTEAEWEYAARAGTDTHWFHGNDPAECDTYGWYHENAAGRTHPVGEKATNPWGLHEIAGNVWEWVQDCWHEDYSGAPSDGSAWDKESGGDCTWRVVRGGGWTFRPGFLRSAFRFWYTSNDVATFNLGFRLARE